jgi:hypothetical protein
LKKGSCAGYGSWLHGEAVAAGMVMAADMSVRLGWIDSSIRDRYALSRPFCSPCKLFFSFSLPVDVAGHLIPVVGGRKPLSQRRVQGKAQELASISYIISFEASDLI